MDSAGAEAADGLPDYLAPEKPVQSFEVLPGRDTLLYGAEGTVLWVPAYAFGAARPGAGPARPTDSLAGPVTLQLREFYSLPDILLHNLTTTSGTDVLETGGMLHLQAQTATGQPCALRPGKELLLRMPAARPLPGMQLYTGVPTARGVDWQRPVPALNRQRFREVGPQLRGTQAAFYQQLRRSLAFSAADVDRLLARPRSRAERQQLRSWTTSRRTRLLEFGRVTLGIDAQGRVTGVNVLGIRDEALRLALDATLRRQAPAFVPAALLGPLPPRKAHSNVLTEVPRRRRWVKAAPLPQVPVAGVWLFDLGFGRDGRVRFFGDDRSFVGQLSTPANAIRSFDTRQARQFLRQTPAGDLNATSVDSLGGYLFSAAGLGWINCDRSARFASQKRVQFGVETPAAGTRAVLVFRRVRGVVPGIGQDAGATRQLFYAAPEGEPATLVAFKRDKGITYLATRAVVLSEGVAPELSFRPVTPEELRAALAQLE
ncbi:hypothetical protein EJV47_26680 [Hymenobacter gummosus]|uniref:Uncharacterized protein n=1 Tax=Hymenobacter gummosus TaxID=1776032 RepID=A0A431TUL7_9BACT|nr:hypothetical protein [Hymenobacter gummosus]RTQ44957.1 hypothetical protein EJV47_26680 [Hymenobacter gummosus]